MQCQVFVLLIAEIFSLIELLCTHSVGLVETSFITASDSFHDGAWTPLVGRGMNLKMEKDDMLFLKEDQ